jgi:PAS domain S-box-containing protein
MRPADLLGNTLAATDMESVLTSLAQRLSEDQPNNQGKLESLVNGLPVVIYAYRPEGGPTFVTEGIRLLWGYEPEDFLRDKSFWKDRVHPDDLKQVFNELPLLLERGTRGYDYRFLTKRGEYRWIHDEVRLVRDSAGNPLEIVGYCVDITERKLMEAALRESEAREKLIFDGTSDLQALFRVERGVGFVTAAVNRAMVQQFRARTGKNANEFVRKDLRELLRATGLTESEIESRLALYQTAIDGRTTVNFETPANGVRDAVEASVTPLMDEQGHCTHVLWNGRSLTERIKAEAGLRESEERYALVLKATHDGIYDWNVVTNEYYLSPRYKEILGYREDELSNDPSSFFDRIHPDDKARMDEAVTRYSEDAMLDSFEDELRLRHKDGTYRWVASRGRNVRDAQGKFLRVLGAISDITERFEAAARLAASEKRLRDILDSLYGFVALCTLDGTLIDANRAPLEAAGLRAEDVVGKPFWDTYSWSHSGFEQTRLREMLARAARGELVRYEANIRVRNGRQLIMDATFGPLRDQHGVITSIIGFGVDITQRKEAEAQLIQARDAAESASRAKSEFLANMSHEIRTPMNGILGLTEVVLDSELEAEQREYLTLVRSSAESLLNIINDILDVSKIEAGKLSLDLRDFGLHDLVSDTVKRLQVAADAKGLRLGYDVRSEVPDLLRGDPGRLRQILINLIGNAIKFTTAGSVTITVQNLPESTDTLHFSVSDTGIGIPPDKQSMIFEAFTQVDGSYTRKFGGTGLGLTIASHLVKLMRGRIWVESKQGQGSTFHFTARLIPAAQ